MNTNIQTPINEKKILFISIWNVVGVLHSPKGKTKKLVVSVHGFVLINFTDRKAMSDNKKNI